VHRHFILIWSFAPCFVPAVLLQWREVFGEDGLGLKLRIYMCVCTWVYCISLSSLLICFDVHSNRLVSRTASPLYRDVTVNVRTAKAVLPLQLLVLSLQVYRGISPWKQFHYHSNTAVITVLPPSSSRPALSGCVSWRRCDIDLTQK